MKKNTIKNLLLGGIALTSLGSVVALSVIISQNKKNKNPIDLLKTYSFKMNKYTKDEGDFIYNFNNSTNPKKLYEINKNDLLASEFAFSSYQDNSSNADNYPGLKNSNYLQKEFWKYQFDWKYNKENFKETSYKNKNFYPLFSLKTKNGKPIDLLEKDFNIYYRAYANDFEGKLYLKINLENKNVDKNKKISERKNEWIGYTYEINGFRKINKNDYIKNNTSKVWNFSTNEKMRLSFYQKTLNSVEDLFEILPHKNIENINDEDNKKTIQNNYETITKYFSFGLDDNILKPVYKINKNRSIWFNYDTNKPDELQINYFLNKYIDAASEDDLSKTKLVEITDENNQPIQFSTTIKIDYFELEKIAKENVKIIPFQNQNLSQIDPSEMVFYKNVSSASTNHKNTLGGWYKDIDLVFKDDFEIENGSKYILKFFDKKIDDIYNSKDENNYKDTPLIKYEKTTGEATFTYIIYNKNNPSSKYIGTYTLKGFQKK
ncbi:MAG1430 family protein [Mycoplasmopsis lipofaciens]|uniref:MAG1430 family protein n=1 Tax=Mycoplasmopsis lipofaciens TaxID=114884 RepID=UPI000486A706|nr:hypothetical protein [Mycoplasmopsis lipofaciens]